MFGWALTLFIIALVAALFGFGGAAGSAAGLAQFTFLVAIVLMVVAFVTNGAKGRV